MVNYVANFLKSLCQKYEDKITPNQRFLRVLRRFSKTADILSPHGELPLLYLLDTITLTMITYYGSKGALYRGVLAFFLKKF